MSAFGFGSPIDDATGCVEDGDEVGAAANGISVGHPGRSGVKIKPADGLTSFVVFNGLDPRLLFSWIFGFGDPSSNDTVVVAEGKRAFGLKQWSGRIGRTKDRLGQFGDGGGVRGKRRSHLTPALSSKKGGEGEKTLLRSRALSMNGGVSGSLVRIGDDLGAAGWNLAEACRALERSSVVVAV
jgi:hypothetical protein